MNVQYIQLKQVYELRLYQYLITFAAHALELQLILSNVFDPFTWVVDVLPWVNSFKGAVQILTGTATLALWDKSRDQGTNGVTNRDITIAMIAEISKQLSSNAFVVEGIADLLHGPISLLKNVILSLSRGLMSLLANFLRLVNSFLHISMLLNNGSSNMEVDTSRFAGLLEQ